MFGDGFSGLIFEKGGKLSIGRCMLIIVFITAMIKWSLGTEIPTSMLNVLMALLAYVLGTKVVGGISDTVQKIKGTIGNVTNVVNKTTGKEVATSDVEPPAEMRGDN